MDRNTIEIDVKGVKVGFKGGTLAIAIACRECGASNVQELFAKLASQDLLANLALLYGSACAFSNRKAPEFTISMMSDIADDMTEGQGDAVAAVLIERFWPKNPTAPQVGAKQEPTP